MSGSTDPGEGFIARHPTVADDAIFAELLESRRKAIANAREYLPSQSSNAFSLFSYSLYEAGLLQMVHPDSPAIVDSLRRAARAMVACCALVSEGAGPVVLDIMGEPVTAGRVAENTFVDVVDFIDGFYAALASRDTASIRALERVDVQRLRVAGVFPEEYSFHWARALQCLGLGVDWVDAYVAAMHGSEPACLRNGQASLDHMFLKSSMEMKLLTDSGADPDIFNASLREALTCHRQYYATVQPNPGEDQSNDPLGFIALGPLAFASVVASHGRPVTVESDYLPRSVLAA